MTKAFDKDLSRGPDPLREYYKPSLGERARDLRRGLVDKVRGERIPRTPAAKLKLTERPPTLFEMSMNDREKWVPKARSTKDREQAEKAAQKSIGTFSVPEWLTASKEARLVALQALEVRLHKMQGRDLVMRIEAAPLKNGERSTADPNARTITIDSILLEKVSPKQAMLELYKQMHLHMQRHAVKSPTAHKEHGMLNIRKWAEPRNGQPSLSKQDAEKYAIRQTDHFQ